MTYVCFAGSPGFLRRFFKDVLGRSTGNAFRPNFRTGAMVDLAGEAICTGKPWAVAYCAAASVVAACTSSNAPTSADTIERNGVGGGGN